MLTFIDTPINLPTDVIFKHTTTAEVTCSVALAAAESRYTEGYVHFFMDDDQHVFKINVVLGKPYRTRYNDCKSLRDLVKSYFTEAFDNFDDSDPHIQLDPFYEKAAKLRSQSLTE